MFSQTARQFIRDAQGNYHPCEEYPNCPHCPMQLSEEMKGSALYTTEKICRACHSERMTLYEVPSEKLIVPLITARDFEKALRRAHSSVGPDELQQFVKWTEEFGQEGG